MLFYLLRGWHQEINFVEAAYSQFPGYWQLPHYYLQHREQTFMINRAGTSLGSLLNFLCTFNLRPGSWVYKLWQMLPFIDTLLLLFMSCYHIWPQA